MSEKVKVTSKAARKLIIWTMAEIADSIIFLWLTVYAIYCLWNHRIYEASAMFIAATVWQRAWKGEAVLRAQQIKAEALKEGSQK